MSDIAANNKRIAKNTALLYIRMLITLSVSLFTSRIVLNALGVEDFGINNVIAGTVAMFTFLNSTLASGTQRFITFALGEKNLRKLQLTFATTFFVHLALAFILGLVILVVGLWFLNGHLNIPLDRMDAAYYVFICSVVTVVFNISQVPYMSTIIAHENMSIYAYMSIFDALARLAVAYALVVSEVDKLKVYAVLLVIVSFINILIYRLYCMRKYQECKIKLEFDRSLLKSILTFSGWNVVGGGAVLCNNQGFNVLLNLFWGPVLNAARGISMQVNNLALQFVGNFQTAVNPQIVKYYALGELNQMNHLIYNNARYAGLLVLFIIIPLTFEINFLLSIWLGQVPEETAFLTKIVLIQTLVQTMSRPVVMGLHATGRMKMPNIISGGILLMILPLSYILFKLGVSLYIVMLINILPWFAECFTDLLLLHRYAGISVFRFYKYVYLNVLLIGTLALLPVLLINQLMEQGWFRLILTAVTSSVWTSIQIYFFGLNGHMRSIVKLKIAKKIRWNILC